MPHADAYQPTPDELALLIALLIHRYIAERGKDVTRFRLARKSVRRLAIRGRLEETIIDRATDVLSLRYGWISARDGDDFVFIKGDSTRGWTKIGTKRMNDVTRKLRNGDESAIDDALDEIEYDLNFDDYEDD